jgi:hypothetical protein
VIKRRKKRDCGCSGHPAGCPKISRGPCYGYGLRPAVRERIRGKAIVRSWIAAADTADVDA